MVGSTVGKVALNKGFAVLRGCSTEETVGNTVGKVALKKRLDKQIDKHIHYTINANVVKHINANNAQIYQYA